MSDLEVLIVMRISVLVIGIIACVIAIKVLSIYGLFILCGDFVYVVAFPQLVCVIYYKYSNAFGAICGYIISFFFRLTAGEPVLNFSPLIKYPYYDEETKTQLFPIRTLAMLLGLITILLVSYMTRNMSSLQKVFRYFDSIDVVQNEEKESDRNKNHLAFVNPALTSDYLDNGDPLSYTNEKKSIDVKENYGQCQTADILFQTSL